MTLPERPEAEITRYRPSDHQELTAFRDSAFGAGSRQTDRARHQWLFDRNPHNDSAGPGIWLCRRDGQIVGQQAEIPFELRIGRDDRLAAWATDLAIDPAGRRQGVRSGLMAAQLEGRSIVAGLHLTDEGYAAYREAGWSDLGTIPIYVRPLDARQTLKLLPSPPLVRLVAPIMGLTWRIADAVISRSTRLRGARLVPVDRFDERADEVWAASADHYAVLARRDRAALDWRIDQRPDSDLLRRYYLVRRRHAVGYAVLRPTTWAGCPAAVVIDYLAPPRWVAPLLLAAGQAIRREGAVAMTVLTRNRAADRSLRAHGFLRRTRLDDPPVRLMVHCVDEPGICALVHDADSWLVTSADNALA